MPETNVHFNIKAHKHILVIFNYFLFKRFNCPNIAQPSDLAGQA